MKRVVAILAVIALGIWLLFRGGDRPAPAPPPVRPPAAVRAAPPPVAPPKEVPRAVEPVPPPAAPEEDAGPAEEPGGSVAGRVTLADGTPVPGLAIGADGQQRDETTDASGHYRLTGIRGDEVRVHCEGCSGAKTARSGDSGIDFTLDEHVLRLRIADAEGHAVEGATVSYTGYRGEEDVMGGAGGITSIEAPTGIRLVISAGARGFVRRATEFRTEGNPRVQEIALVLQRPGDPGSLALHVAADEGKPPRKVWVRLDDQEGSALEGFWDKPLDLDSDGRGTLGAVPEGSYRLVVRDSKAPNDLTVFGMPAAADVVVESGRATPADVLLRSGGWIRVVTRKADGTPAAATYVNLKDEAGKEVRVHFMARLGEAWAWPSDSDGPRLSERPVPPGRYTVEVQIGPQTEPRLGGTAECVVGYRQVTEVEVRLAE